eukprot:GDKH01006318.1.p1 GENE.GDKH01006318.1~~GDKH01006318.1.p1  ORF type:complete len:191 (+),score=13.38 GDKH01006318.1:186-758(+)
MADLFGALDKPGEVEEAEEIHTAEGRVVPRAHHEYEQQLAFYPPQQPITSFYMQPFMVPNQQDSSEVHKLKDEIMHLQRHMLDRGPTSHAPVVIHNNTNVAATTHTTEKRDDPPPRRERWWIEKLWDNKFNRLMALGGTVLAVYMLQLYFRHRWKIEQYQKHIDSQPFVKIANQILGTPTPPPSRFSWVG